MIAAPPMVTLAAGTGTAGACVLLALGLVLRARRSRAQDQLTAEAREALAAERRAAWRRHLTLASITIAFVIIFCIAGIAAWLSFGAQRAYAFHRNGGSWPAATGIALLLDAGALGLSLLRLAEALTIRSSALTRLYLAGFIGASAIMNLLHAPSATTGGRLVAVIPPLVYAIGLETLLTKVEQLILGTRHARTTTPARGYSLLLWAPWPIGAPVRMWRAWRTQLLSTLPAPGPAPGSERETPAAAGGPHPVPVPLAPAAAPALQPPPAKLSAAVSRPHRHAEATVTTTRPPVHARPATKKDQLRDELLRRVRDGDLDVLSDQAPVRNAAAYRVNEELGQQAGLDGGLMADGAVRTALRDLLPELRQAHQTTSETSTP